MKCHQKQSRLIGQFGLIQLNSGPHFFCFLCIRPHYNIFEGYVKIKSFFFLFLKLNND